MPQPVDPRPPSETASSTRPPVRGVIALAPVERTTFFPGDHELRLRTLLPAAQWYDPAGQTSGDWERVLQDAQPELIVSGWQTRRLPNAVPGLKYVCHVMGSVRGLIPRELVAEGLAVSNWGGIAAPMVAEHALLLVLGALRAMPRWTTVMEGDFSQAHRDTLGARSLAGCRVSLHGFGQIARHLVELMKPFKVDIEAYSEGVPAAFMLAHGVRPAASLQSLAARADVLVTCEALTERTRKSLGYETLSALPHGSVFVNVGRGSVVDEDALAAVARERNLRVASDVYATEPLPPDAAMRRIPDALFSPHIGGPTVDRYPVCGEMAIENVERYLTGRRLENGVTLDIYDRST